MAVSFHLPSQIFLKPRGGAKPHFFLAATRGTGQQILRWQMKADRQRNRLIKFHCSRTSSWVSNFNSRAQISVKRDFLDNRSIDFAQISIIYSLGIEPTVEKKFD